MEKLIELLNEFDSGWSYDDYYGPFQYGQDRDAYHLCKYQLVSKEYGFIKWLVENEKIAYDIPNNSDLYKCFELACIPLDNTDYITMLLSIQDEPIEFLVSILK